MDTQELLVNKKMKKTIDFKIIIPGLLHKSLTTYLNFAVKNITNTKSRNSFKNAYWAISALLINECCYENDNLDFFVNIHQDNFIKISGMDKRKITDIKDVLIKSGIFECNFHHCNSGPKSFSYGYRLSPTFHHLFNSKRTNSNDIEEIIFTCSDKFIEYKYGLNIDSLNKLKKRIDSSRTLLYIKRGNDSNEVIDSQYFTYEDRTEMNEWEEIISKRMSKITVNLSSLYQHQGNDFKKLYWVGRIIKSTPDKDVIFSHGRLYRNPYWHCLPKEFRQYCVYDNEEKMMEVFDVKNCFATLTLKLLEGNVPDDEYDRFKRTVKTGIYEDIAAQTVEYDRNDMKKPFCHWLFSNSKTKKLPINQKFTIVRNYFKNEFPNIFNFLLNYPEVEVEENGKKVKKSKLSVDCQWIENKLVLNTLAKWVEEKFNVEVVTLHDAICVKENDFLKVDPNEVKRMWYNIMNF